jgi:hypothetical protein
MKYNSHNVLFSLACEVESKSKYGREQLAKNETDACLAEIERLDTHIVEVSFATNFTHDVKNTNGSGNLMEENEHELASFSHMSLCTEKVNKGNDMCSMISQGDKSLDEPNLSTVHAIVEQSIVGHSSNLTLSSDDCLVIPCDKEEFCDDNTIISTP